MRWLLLLMLFCTAACNSQSPDVQARQAFLREAKEAARLLRLTPTPKQLKDKRELLQQRFIAIESPPDGARLLLSQLEITQMELDLWTRADDRKATTEKMAKAAGEVEGLIHRVEGEH